MILLESGQVKILALLIRVHVIVVGLQTTAKNTTYKKQVNLTFLHSQIFFFKVNQQVNCCPTLT